ncbi:Ribosomal RNA small subunit methyltransferase E [Thalassoglobus neptunius]|uniref:Ribosomal RNA small subunit methyltransferase E n=1 Tax=Thalassoglobus neptunius TaxID=1938619 RepID=A0A5C5X3R1_9PLAN|nr:RsmE family RNA methyltransferase [Thalassoglobus neptunius]TWT57596.1 Ribosomal RNA small subunit methyltransferase E [Thalassoglobus neptunius]
MADRFYYVGPWEDEITLDGPEAHHLATVLRQKTGNEVELFDGLGTSASGQLIEVAKRSVRIRLLSAPAKSAERPTTLTLAVAPPKRDRLQWLVEKATELGVDRFVPLLTERSVVKPRPGKLERLTGTAIEACKQSGRNQLMEIAPTTSLPELLQQSKAEHSHLMFGDVPEKQERSHRAPILPENVSSIIVCIGPEGGFSPDELQLLRDSEARPISISSNILRVETAAIALAAVLVSQIDTHFE